MNTKLILLAILGTAAMHVAAADQNASPVSAQPELDQKELTAGFRALESACFSCHSPHARADNRIAPPMAAIKKHYIDTDTTYEDFRDQLVRFVNNPTRENSQMPGAINRFGLMPRMSFDTAEVEQIAYYIYHNPLEAPDWFEQHYQEEQQKRRRIGQPKLTTDAEYLQRGKEVAMSTKAALGSNLKQAINSGGTVSAIDFCKTSAIPITDRMSLELDASVKRVSDRPRNPDNAASAAELKYIASAKSRLAAQEKPAPALQEIDGQMVGYYPIITNGMCLQCHGTPGQALQNETTTALRTRYPEDQATGYGENELRGIFVISMDKQ